MLVLITLRSFYACSFYLNGDPQPWVRCFILLQFCSFNILLFQQSVFFTILIIQHLIFLTLRSFDVYFYIMLYGSSVPKYTVTFSSSFSRSDRLVQEASDQRAAAGLQVQPSALDEHSGQHIEWFNVFIIELQYLYSVDKPAWMSKSIMRPQYDH